MRTWGMDGTFKVVPQWYQQLFTIHALWRVSWCQQSTVYVRVKILEHSTLINKAAVLEVDLNPDTIICDVETALILAIQGYFLNTRVQGCYFHFCQAVHRKVSELGLKTRYRTDEQTRRKIRMLLATAFLPVPQVDMGVSLPKAGTTGQITTWKVGTIGSTEKRLNAITGCYELLQIMIAEQGVMDITNVLSGNAAVERGAECMGEYNSSSRTLEQFLPSDFTHSKSFTALNVRSSSSNPHYFNVCVEYQPFLSTDTDLINLIRFLWFLFSHTVSTLYTGIKQDPSSRGLLRSSKKYTIVFVYVIPYANSKFKRTYNYTFVSVD
ncbi:hypothetical protein T12_8477, partial [Trichinella patagoniensis]